MSLIAHAYLCRLTPILQGKRSGNRNRKAPFRGMLCVVTEYVIAKASVLLPLGLIRKRSDMRTDATHVVASVRNMNRGELVGETLRAALNVIATVDPKWLAANVDSSWYLKYAKRFEPNRAPRTKEDMAATTEEVGLDGMTLLERVWQDSTPRYLRTLPAVEILRQCWVEQFWVDEGVVRLRHAGSLRPPRFVLIHRTIRKLVRASNAQRNGLDTRFISRKSAHAMYRI